ncbi:MAG TPA: YHYH protein [Gemmataceae bacterium]|nr:YHYH protein [Gemmataceae bacterium]
MFDNKGALGILCSGMLLVCIGTATGELENTGKTNDPGKPIPKHPFNDNVTVTVTDTHLIVESDGIPNHETGKFPNRDNPNRILKQHYRFYIPLKPRIAEQPRKTPFGPIGVAINGIPFYNQYNAEGQDAVQVEKFDSCCGHPDPNGRYHYHKYPVCLKSPFHDEPGKHSPPIGYAFDGFAIYGPNGEGGKPPTDLDECNGHSDKERGYHYHVTAKFPYILGAYRGVVEEKNLTRPGRSPSDRPPRKPPLESKD